MSIEDLGPGANWLTRWMFRHLPAILMAEPFECFIIGYVMIVGVQIVVAAAIGPSQPQLYVVLGKVGLVIWAIALFAGAVMTTAGLVIVSRRSAVSVEDRKWEFRGLATLITALGLYALVLPFRSGLSSAFLIAQTVFTELILLGFIISMGVRMAQLRSPAFLLAVTRLTRIRLMKEMEK